MQLEKIVHIIDDFDDVHKAEIIEMLKIIKVLYSQYGQYIMSDVALDHIKSESEDLVMMIELVHKYVGLEKIGLLIQHVAKKYNGITIETNNPGSDIIVKLQGTLQNVQLKNSGDQVGIKISSDDGKIYERMLEKDIQKLVHSKG